MFGVADGGAVIARHSDEGRRLEGVVADFDDVAQRVAIELVRQQIEEGAEVCFIKLFMRRKLPEQRAEFRTQFGNAGFEKAFDRVAGFRQHTAIDRVTRPFQREHEIVRYFRRPFAVRLGRLRRIERAIDLDGGQALAGISQFFRVRQAFWIKHAAPRLIGPAADAHVRFR